MKLWLNFLFLIAFHFSFSQDTSTVKVFYSMMKAIEDVKTCSYALEIHERINDNIREDKYIVKVQSHPYKTYTYSIIPNPGSEALYIEGENNGKVLVNPNRFPFFNLNLSAHNFLLRKGHQFTILQQGFNCFYRIISGYLTLNKEKLLSVMHLTGDVTWDNRSCYQLMIDVNDFHWYDYTVQKDETLISIADRLLLNDYMILERNNLSDYDDVKKGQKISLPSAFAKKLIFYIDKATLLPLCQIAYDDKGFYAKIELKSFVLNPVFKPDELTGNFEGYGF